MNAWLKRAFSGLRSDPAGKARRALAECHAEAWGCAEWLIQIEERGVRPTEAERCRVLEALTKIARLAAHENGWIG